LAGLLASDADEQLAWIGQLRSTNAKHSAANCFDRVRTRGATGGNGAIRLCVKG
jgi:hypothetical protein